MSLVPIVPSKYQEIFHRDHRENLLLRQIVDKSNKFTNELTRIEIECKKKEKLSVYRIVIGVTEVGRYRDP